MARILHQLTIFVSGPGTVEAEKAALRVVVDEINRRSVKTHAVTLRVVGWPEDIRPGVNKDAQSEIEYQIGGDFDIYVGIIGSRFGTPTIRSGSGTEQEFEDALAKFRSDSTTVRLLFYFKRNTEDPFLIDPSQLQKVLNFRQSLGDRGILYRDVRDTADFTNLVREHLYGLIIDEWRGDKWAEAIPALPTRESCMQPPAIDSAEADLGLNDSVVQNDDEELGVLEYMAAFQDASDAIIGVMSAISQETERVGDEIKTRSAEAERITADFEKQKGVGGSRLQQQFLGQTRETVDRAAGNLEDYTTAMTPNVEQYRILNRAMFDNLRRGFHARKELGSRDDEADRDALAGLIPVIHQSREHVMNFQTSISRIPALTGRFKRSRKRAAAILGEMVAEMSFSIQEATALLEATGGPGDSGATE